MRPEQTASHVRLRTAVVSKSSEFAQVSGGMEAKRVGPKRERDAEHDSDKSAYNTNDADEQFKLAETIGNQETKNKSVKEYFNAK
jgi:redox-regulated HSP33 family molecular chaperone